MPQSLLTGQLKEKPTYRVWCLYSSSVHGAVHGGWGGVGVPALPFARHVNHFIIEARVELVGLHRQNFFYNVLLSALSTLCMYVR
jgi:hypothetical protein